MLNSQIRKTKRYLFLFVGEGKESGLKNNTFVDYTHKINNNDKNYNNNVTLFSSCITSTHFLPQDE